jgi:hypothetical protein
MINLQDLFEKLPKDDIQNTLDLVLEGQGILATDYDLVNETERIRKKKELEDQKKEFNKRLILTGTLFLGGFIALWYITQKIKK